MTEELNLSEIKIDGGTQPREAISDETVAEYAEAIAVGQRRARAAADQRGQAQGRADNAHE